MIQIGLGIQIRDAQQLAKYVFIFAGVQYQGSLDDRPQLRVHPAEAEFLMMAVSDATNEAIWLDRL